MNNIDKTIPLPSQGWILTNAMAFCWRVQSMGLLRAISHESVRPGLWFFGWIWKTRLFLHWKKSPKVTAEALAIRNVICNDCPELDRDGEKRYCKACGCPKWYMSELGTKNELAGHNCPLGKHPGSVALPVIQQPASTGCAGCGDKS